MVPVRDVVVVFAATEKFTSPLPVPLAVVTVIHAAPEAAVQAQPAVVVTVNFEAPPSEAAFRDVGLIEYVHGAAAAAA